MITEIVKDYEYIIENKMKLKLSCGYFTMMVQPLLTLTKIGLFKLSLTC